MRMLPKIAAATATAMAILLGLSSSSSAAMHKRSNSQPISHLYKMLADVTRNHSTTSHGLLDSLFQDLSGMQYLVQPDHPVTLANGMTNQPSFRVISLGQLQPKPLSIVPIASGSSSSSRSHPGITNSDEALRGSQFIPINPPSIPLAVRNPYVSAWLPSGSSLSSTPPNTVGNGGYLAGQWPAFWTSSYSADGQYRLGWSGYIRIDGTTYEWMGNGFGTLVRAGKAAQQLSVEYTSTRTVFKFVADRVKFTVTFLTPITPHDYLRQSIPLSYLHIQLDPSTLGGRSIQLFTDIDERWVTGHDYDWQDWSYDEKYMDHGNSSIHFISRKYPQVYTEFRQRAEWGSATYAARQQSGLTSRNNNNMVVHSEFIDTGKVSIDHGPVLGPDNSFAFALDFSAPGAPTDALFAVGHMRTPYVSYIRAKHPNSNSTASYQQDRYGYWQSKFDTIEDAVDFFLGDFANALGNAIAFDAQVADDSRSVVGGGNIGDKYAAITQLSVRQAFATVEITVPKTESGQYDVSDTLAFLKEISSNGDMSTVDLIFPLFPLLSYTNPTLLRDLMLPIFEYTESGMYPNKWCVHDLGVYPNAFGHNDGNDEPMQVEESGNMIWMALHYAQLVSRSEAVHFLQDHYPIMKQWAEFLIEDSLIPATQLSTDDFAGTLANQTNLAIKGIEAIAAMGVIADMIGQTNDAQNYRNISTTYVRQWQKYAISDDKSHIKLSYQDDKSWGTLYNLFADRLLNLKLVPKAIYDLQDNWYPKVSETYAVPLDSRHKWAKTDWQMMTAATSANTATRDLFIRLLYRYVSNGITDAPFSDLMESTTGDFPKQPHDPMIHFLARPVVGGHFALLARMKADKANRVETYQYGPSDNDVVSSSSSHHDDDDASSPLAVPQAHRTAQRVFTA